MAKICNIHQYSKGEGSQEARDHFLDFCIDGQRYHDLVSSKAQKQLDYTQGVIDQYYLTPETQNLNVIYLIQSIQANLIDMEERKNAKLGNQEKVLKLQRASERRAGFINASILLSVIINAGIIIAVVLIIL